MINLDFIVCFHLNQYGGTPLFRKIIVLLLLLLLLFGAVLGETADKKNEKNKNNGKRNLLRGIAECSALMAVSQINYWLKYSNWIEDWQYKLTWKDQTKRIFGLDGQKFDSNPFVTNWTHALSGALYYNFARTNGLDLYDSSLFTTITSLYWEFIVEWREVISVNDNIFTSLGGIAIGESFFQLGSYFNGRTGLLNNIAGILTNPIMVINRLLDKNRGYSYAVPDKRLMTVYFGSYFSMEDREAEAKSRNHFIGFQSSLTYLPRIIETGKLQKRIKGLAISEVDLNLELTEKGIMDEMNVNSRNMYNGSYTHHIRKYEDDRIWGHSMFYSLISGYDFYKEKSIAPYDSDAEYKYIDESMLVETPTRFTDKLAVINIIGPYMEWQYYFGKWKLMLTNAVTLDFALVNAFALNTYTETGDVSYTKATLYNYGYYYGLGFTLNSRFHLSYGNIYLNLAYKYQDYNSIEGIDRFQEELINDFNIHDRRGIFNAEFGMRFTILPIGLKLKMENRYRWGSLRDTIRRERETKVYMRVELLL